MIDYKGKSTTNILPIILAMMAGGLGVYSLYRAAALSFTHDESLTYNEFIWRPVQHIISGKVSTANNHIINTLLMKLFAWMFGNNDFALRLPNVLAHFCYIFFSYSLARRLKSPTLVLCGFVLLNFNPFLLDFFSLARGYGLSIALMMASISFFMKFFDERRDKRSLFWCFFCAFFAVFSCFTMLLFYAALIVAFVLNIKITATPTTRAKAILKELAIPVLISILMASYSYTPISRLIEHGQLYYGGTTGFWHDTVSSLIKTSLYDQNYANAAAPIVNGFLILSLALIVALLVFITYKRRAQTFQSEFVIFAILFALPCLLSLMQCWFTGSKYMLDRTALFLIPLFFLCFIFACYEVLRTTNAKKIVHTFAITITSVFFLHTLLAANFDHTLLWKYDATTKELLNDLETQVKADGRSADTIKLGVTWFHAPSMNYYKTVKGLKWLAPVTREGFQGPYDYYFLQDEDVSQLQNKDIKVIKKYPLSGSTFLK